MKKKLSPQEEDEEDPCPSEAEPWVPDFQWLTEHVAVGGSFPPERTSELARDHGIAAVVDLRSEQCDDEAELRRHRIDFLHLPTPDLEPASAAMLNEGVRFAADHIERGNKLLIHCQHGIGRSALLALCVLVHQGWEPLEALEHAKNRRERISPSELQYRGWAEWLRKRGTAAPDYHSFGCVAYRHLANG